MKKLLCLLALGLVLPSSPTLAAPFTAGNVVVLRCEGVVNTGNVGSLVEFTSGGAEVQTATLPSNGATEDATSIVFGGASAFTHALTLSADGSFIVISGFGNTFTTVDTSTSANSRRVVATMKYDGTYARPFAGTNFSGIPIRSATSDGLGNFWATGQNDLYYLNTSVRLEAGGNRVTAIFNGKLHRSVALSVSNYVALPTAAEAATLTLSLNADGGVASSTGYAFPVNPTIGSKAYVGNVGTGTPGIQCFTNNGSGWVYQYTIILQNGDKPQHISVDYSGAAPVIYAVHGVGYVAGNRISKVIDNGPTAGDAITTVFATAPAGTAFRGLVMAPTQPALPTFTVHPVGATNNAGATVVFGPVSANNANGYTWKKGATTLTDGGNISGATTPTLTITSITSADVGSYRAVASNNGGSVDSNPAILALTGSAITTELVSRTNAAGTIASFHVAASGSAPFSYVWTHDSSTLTDGGNISGATTDTLTISNVQDPDAGNYTVTVTDNSSVQSVSAASLTVVNPPVVTVQPGNQSKVAGATANFSVTATGGSLSYKWFKGPTPLSNGLTGTGSTVFGAQTANLSISNVQSGDAGSYSVTVTNLAGPTTSDPATLTIGQAPAIVAVSSSTNAIGSTAILSGSGITGSTLSYIWRHEGTVIGNDGHFSGADTATLTVNNVDIPDRRIYSLTVSNEFGTAVASGQLFVIINTNQPNDVPNLIVYEPFNYPNGNSGVDTVYSWENLISIYNRITGQPVYWQNTGGGRFSAVADNNMTDYVGISQFGGLYPWPGIDSNGKKMWTFSASGNNNHLKFGGVTNGSVYFSFTFVGGSGSPINGASPFEVIAGFTSGSSASSGINANTWSYALCTKPADDGSDSFRFGVFKGHNGSLFSNSATNGQFAPQVLVRGALYLVVGSYKINSGGTSTNDDVVSLWINPVLSTFGAAEGNVPTPDAGGTMTNWANNGAITEFGIRSQNSGNPAPAPFSKELSDLRIGKTWASVTGPYFPTLKVTVDSSTVTLSWPAKDSPGIGFEFPSGHYGYQLQSATDVTGPYNYEGTIPNDDGTTKSVTVTAPSVPQFWRLFYPPRTGTPGQY